MPAKSNYFFKPVCECVEKDIILKMARHVECRGYYFTHAEKKLRDQTLGVWIVNMQSIEKTNCRVAKEIELVISNLGHA